MALMDAVGLRNADAGISDNTATNVDKDSANIPLAKKGLSIIIDCVVIGRATQSHT
jgi:cation transport ATPase